RPVLAGRRQPAGRRRRRQRHRQLEPELGPSNPTATVARDRSRTAVAAPADGPPKRQRAARGFTLVEVMVVVLIIGIMLTFATLSVGDRAAGDTIEPEARRLQELFRLASEEAELKGFEIGFRHTPTLYQFLAIDTDGDWKPIAEGPLRPREIPPLLNLRLRVDGRPVPPAQDIPPGAAA